jgi:hypothetical protein
MHASIDLARSCAARFVEVQGMDLVFASVLWLPDPIASSADPFGLIGVAFALLSWLVVAGVVVAATSGAVVAERYAGEP